MPQALPSRRQATGEPQECLVLRQQNDPGQGQEAICRQSRLHPEGGRTRPADNSERPGTSAAGRQEESAQNTALEAV